MKGEETEENVRLLLSIEKAENPIEIVLHVYKLKEGWDVNNLFTIIPLNAAKSDNPRHADHRQRSASALRLYHR